ncbi:hypothetical protein MP228_000854 [Amoeboaphelidium protococcarum]|nr:hypothetical protein MP228_000854 [Amoeboaphelidium protococcarum]
MPVTTQQSGPVPAAVPPAVPRRRGLTQVSVVKVSKEYKAQKPDELNVDEGDIVCIIESGYKSGGGGNSLGHRVKCRVNNKEGYVPADILAESSEIDHPLHEAAKRGNVEFIKDLMKAGASINTLDSANNTAFYWACRFGHLDCAKILLAGNPVIDTQNVLGDTALHGAAWGGYPEAVKLILQHPDGIQLTRVKNVRGQYPRDLAKNVDCASLLQNPSYALSPGGSNTVQEDDEEQD